MKKFVTIPKKKKGKTAINKWESDDSDVLLALYSVYKKLGQFFFHT